jgi:cytochrome P450 StaP
MSQAITRTIPAVLTDFTAEDYHARLYEHYAAWHRDTPVFRNQAGVVYLTRHADCALMFGDQRFARRADDGRANPLDNQRQEAGALHAMIANWVMFMDPPRHAIVRRAFGLALSAREAQLPDGAIRAIARELLDAMAGGAPVVDFVSGFATPLPTLVICHLMGLPAADHSRLNAWAIDLSSALDSGAEDAMRAAEPAALAMHDYFGSFVESRAARAREGFLRTLLEAGASPSLSDAELVDGCAFLLVAGHETTRNLIASGMLALAQNRDQMALMRDEPALRDAAVEELLRYTGPVQKISRWTRENLSIGGYEVPCATLVTGLIGAANRDPACFRDPDRLDIRRSPNPHLAFGRGRHACIGRALALREIGIAYDELLRAFAQIEVIEHRWSRNAAMRGLASLSLRMR